MSVMRLLRSKPKDALMQMAMANPNYKNVMAYIQQNGGDPKAAFYQMAKEKGVDPEAFLANIR